MAAVGADGTLVEVCAEPLSLDRYVAAVADDGAGAITTFIGVTRNTFEGKRVLRLEYEAYTPMARGPTLLAARGPARASLSAAPPAAPAAGCEGAARGVRAHA
jgi:hypothetical protein